MKWPGSFKIVMALVSVLGLLTPSMAQEAHSQSADPLFDPGITKPSYIHDGPVVCFDEAHRNFHTMDGRYSGLTALLRADGFQVVAGTEAFSSGSLDRCRLLIIANARGPEEPGDPAFTPAEVTAVESWVHGGGSLLLIADHAPFGGAAASLGEPFGVGMLNGWVKDPGRQDAPNTGAFILRFDREAGLLGDHPITRGRGPEEEVRSVVTYGGQALAFEDKEGVLISFSPTARNVLNPREPDPDSETSVAGWPHAVATEHGRGRAVIVGEAAFFSAQVIRGRVARAAGVEELRIGMTRTDTGNRQFAVNTIHWLSGLL